MNKSLIVVFLIVLVNSGCQRNAQLKRVVEDLSSTPHCNDKPVLVKSNDTKSTLTAKLIISNYKIACFKDYVEYTIKKLEAYKKL